MPLTTPGGSSMAARSTLRPIDKGIANMGVKGLILVTQHKTGGAKGLPTMSDGSESTQTMDRKGSTTIVEPGFRRSQIVGAGPNSLSIISSHREPLQPRDENVTGVSKRSSLIRNRPLEDGLKKLAIFKVEKEMAARKPDSNSNENQLPNSASTSNTHIAVQGGSSEPANNNATSRRGGSAGRRGSHRRGNSPPANPSDTRPYCVTCGWELRYKVMLIARGVDNVAAKQRWSFIINRRAPGDPPLGHWCGIEAALNGGWVFRRRHIRHSDRHDRLAEHVIGFLHQADLLAFQAVLAHYPIDDETSKAWCLRSLQMACEEPCLNGFGWNNVQEIMAAFQETIGSGWTGSP